MKPYLRSLLDDPKNFLAMRYGEGFKVDGCDLDDFYLQAAQKKYRELNGQVAALKRLSKEQGIEDIASFDDLIRVLFPHTVYKSYPLSFLEKSRFDKLTKWLNGLTALDLNAIDASECASIDEWLELLDNNTALRISHSAGTTGKLSFLPRTLKEAENVNLILRDMIRDWYGDDTGPDLIASPLPYIQPSYNGGYYTMLRGAELRAELFGVTEENSLYLYPDRMSADVCSLAGRIRAAESKGEGGSIELSPGLMKKRDQYIQREIDKKDSIRTFFQQAVDKFGGKSVFLCTTWTMLYDAMVEARERGIDNIFGKDSVLVSGGGNKGYDLPDNWKEVIFTGLGFDRAYELYGMSEMMSGFPVCEHGHYHIPPVVIPFVLDPISGESLPRSGTQTGRFAFLDLMTETYWGGFISGDEVTMSGFDGDCECGRKGLYLHSEIRRYSEKEGGDDKINCSGAPEAHDKALEYLLNAAQ
ncbi:Uncharacterised protein [Halioglobus japonicus]|nr:Uncharacterised protein [Halioglobus japonicus]